MQIGLRELIWLVSLVGGLVGVYVALDRRVTRIEAARAAEERARQAVELAEEKVSTTTNEALCARIEALESGQQGLTERVGALEERVGAVDSTCRSGFVEVLGAIRKLRPSTGA